MKQVKLLMGMIFRARDHSVQVLPHLNLELLATVIVGFNFLPCYLRTKITLDRVGAKQGQ